MIRVLIMTFAFAGLTWVPNTYAGTPDTGFSRIRKSTESQLRNLIEPLLNKYCPDQCKLLEVQTQVQTREEDSVSPGFDEVHPRSMAELAPASARLKILMDDAVGPVSRSKLVELIQQHLDVLDFPVTIDAKTARFPQPLASTRKVNELRERIATDFKSTLNQLFERFCPQQCTLADFELKVDPVNPEEAQFGSTGEYFQDGDTAVRIRKLSSTVLLDTTLTQDERTNIVEMARFKTNQFKNVELNAAVIQFPHPVAFGDGATGGRGLASSRSRNGRGGTDSTDTYNLNKTDKSLANSESKNLSTSNSNSTQNNSASNSESNNRAEKSERYEKLERVENGDAVQAELKKFQQYAAIFGGSILLLLVFLSAILIKGGRGRVAESIQKFVHSVTPEPVAQLFSAKKSGDSPAPSSGASRAAQRLEIENLIEELTATFAEYPKVAKQVFSRVLTEEGVEVTAQYIHIFGESVVMDLIKDPSLQQEFSELLEYYARTEFELEDPEKLDLLRRLHNRSVAGKLLVLGKRSSNLFEFLIEMDALQILELIRNESLTIKAIVMTQCDSQKRSSIFSHLDDDTRMNLLTELSRIDYLPKDYIHNVAAALKRKRSENPRLNTEALPGSDVLVGLLERTSLDQQRNVVQSLETSNPDNARAVKSKLVSIDTLAYLRDSHLLEMVLGLKHDELLQFLKGAPEHIRKVIFSKSPRELVAELEEELGSISVLNREGYQNIERKLMSRLRVMANDGSVNLIEVNERMFSGSAPLPGGPSQSVPVGEAGQLKKVAGW